MISLYWPCTAGRKHIQDKSEQNDAPFCGHTTDRVETKDKFKFFCKPDELLCRTYEIL